MTANPIPLKIQLSKDEKLQLGNRIRIKQNLLHLYSLFNTILGILTFKLSGVLIDTYVTLMLEFHLLSKSNVLSFLHFNRRLPLIYLQYAWLLLPFEKCYEYNIFIIFLQQIISDKLLLILI